MNVGNENFKIVCPAKVRNFVDINGNKIISALSAIALVMDNYHASTPMSCHNFSETEELNEKLNLCQSDLRVKRKRIKKLKENLRKACIVAKTIMSAKENETMSLHDGICNARSECADLYVTNKLNSEMIAHQKSENKALLEKIQHLNNFIRLGYEELQKMRDVPVDNDASTVIQLKEIILSCGQYYADYCNERDTRIQIEQRNRFLSNKISLLDTNRSAVVEELKNVKYENSRLRKENSVLKNKLVKIIEGSSNKNDVENDSSFENLNVNKLKNGRENQTFDLSSHLRLVKNLLNDQDVMLKDLKILSEELNCSSNLSGK